jgi:hypothetical protein
MKQACHLCIVLSFVSTITVPTSILAQGSLELKNNEMAILTINGAPVGIQSNLGFMKLKSDDPPECRVYLGDQFPAPQRIKLDETLRIKVEGDKDIAIQCKGEDGIVVRRE